ncbi:MAG: WD40 repeat domain-containing protein [Planctomycetaceae bacterium]
MSCPTLKAVQLHAIHAVAFASNQPILAGGAEFLLLQHGREKEVLRNTATGEVHAIRFSDDGRILATGHEGQAIQLWDTATANCCQQLGSRLEENNRHQFQPGGDLIAAAGESKGDVRIYHYRGRNLNPADWVILICRD